MLQRPVHETETANGPAMDGSDDLPELVELKHGEPEVVEERDQQAPPGEWPTSMPPAALWSRTRASCTAPSGGRAVGPRPPLRGAGGTGAALRPAVAAISAPYRVGRFEV